MAERDDAAHRNAVPLEAVSGEPRRRNAQLGDEVNMSILIRKSVLGVVLLGIYGPSGCIFRKAF